MKRILAPILLLTLLFPSLAYGLEFKDLIKRDRLYSKKLNYVPLTGMTDGDEQGSIKNGKRFGLWMRHYGGGQLMEKGTFKDGRLDGPYVSYYDNGKVWSKGTYKNDKKDGPWVNYFPNGTIDERYTGTYKNGVKVFD